MPDPSGPGAVLAEAFHDDPMFVFVEPDADRRRRVLPWFFGTAARLGRQSGRLDEDAGRGAAIWLRPGRARLGPAAVLRCGLALAPVRLGIPAFRRLLAITSAFEAAGRRVQPARYWHLFMVGVRPREQGRGVAGRLLAPVLAEADSDGTAVYLETTQERNLPFYRGLGFSVMSAHTDPGLPPFWTMLRGS